MGTPTSDEIREEAEADYMSSHSDREGYGTTNRPEVHELKEGGQWDRARAKLMSQRGEETHQRAVEKRASQKHTEHKVERHEEAKPSTGAKIATSIKERYHEWREEKHREHKAYVSGKVRGQYERGVREGRGVRRQQRPSHGPGYSQMHEEGAFSMQGFDLGRPDIGRLEGSLGYHQAPSISDLGLGFKMRRPPTAREFGFNAPRRAPTAGFGFPGARVPRQKDILGFGLPARRRKGKAPWEF